MTRKAPIPVPLICSAVAFVTLWVGSASAEDFAAIFHGLENQALCMNNPYQSGNGNHLVVDQHCDKNDPELAVRVADRSGSCSHGWGTHRQNIC
jgi:hypothetical protein